MKNKTRKANKQIVGKIYANWCGFCTALQPHWDKMKSEIKHLPIEFVEIEASETARLDKFTKKHNINVIGYPTIFKIVDKVEYYQGSPDADSIKSWILSNKMKGGRKKRNNKTKRRK